MILADVMDELATQLGTINGLKVYGYPPSSAVAVSAWVDYPEAYDFDRTFGRGLDSMTVPVMVVFNRNDDKTTRNLVSDYAAGSGPKSVKAVLQAGTYTTLRTVRVSRVEFGYQKLAEVDYVAAKFYVDITGPGSVT